ncbi:RidA family protein [Bacillus massiliigorillae]|uniref:RidA family protein n=1 Tax=Bacillus massiliigorillae TaxID=1243664 RepID=UPI00039E6A5F|nr:RidA family protein [Bacillus massiliigorillae]
MLEIINTEKAPAAIGPYCQGIKVNNMLYASGAIPINPATGEVVEGGVTEQAKQVMENVKAVLEAANSDLESVVKTTCFIVDMNDFAAFNAVYGEYFANHKPARSCVAVRELPKGVLCEVEVIAVTK